MKLIVGQKRAVVTIDATRLSNKEPKAHFLIGRKQIFLCRGIVNQLSFDVMIEPRWLRHQQHFVSGDAFTKICKRASNAFLVRGCHCLPGLVPLRIIPRCGIGGKPNWIRNIRQVTE